MSNAIIDGETQIKIGSIFNAQIAAGAAVAYSKLALTGSVVDGDLVSISGSKVTGAYTAAGLTLATARLLGRTAAGSGAAQEISVAGSLSLSGGVLTGTAAGTVTAVSVVTANGFAGSSSGGATPALTLTTTITGILKGNGTAISAGTAGTDYSAGTSALGTGILKSTTTTGALTIAIAADFPTLNQNTTGSAATLTTARLIGGVSFNGSADITVATATGGFTVSGSPFSVTAFGTHTFSASGTGANRISVRNTNTAAGTQAVIDVTAATQVAALYAFAPLYGASADGWDVANGGALYSANPGGWSIVARDAAGAIRFYTGGSSQTMGLSAAGLLSVSGFGTHAFSAGSAGAQILKIANTSAGTSNQAVLQAASDTVASNFASLSSTYTTGTYDVQSGAYLSTPGSGGLSIAAIDAAGVIRFYSGGTTQRMLLSAAGDLSASSATDASSSTTGAIKTAGGMGIAKKLYVGTSLDVGTTLNVSSTTDASSSTTGAITTAGGLGVAKKLYAGTELHSQGTLIVDGLTTLSGAGTNSLTANHANPLVWSVINSNNNTTSTAVLSVACHGSFTGSMTGFAQNFSNNGTNIHDSVLIEATGTGGLSLAAASSVGVIRFYSGAAGVSATLQMTLSATGELINAGAGFSMTTWPTSGSAANAVLTNATVIQKSTSSRRYKAEIEPLDREAAIAAIMGLRPVTYRANTDLDQRRYPGLIAEEVAEIDPMLATYDGPNMTGDPNYVLYDRIPAYLVAVVQSLSARLAAIETGSR